MLYNLSCLNKYYYYYYYLYPGSQRLSEKSHEVRLSEARSGEERGNRQEVRKPLVARDS